MISRHFTNGIEYDCNNLNENQYQVKDIEIKNDKTGEVIFEEKGCIFPKDFSDTACNVIASKYFNRGVHEKSYYDVIQRMVNFWKDALIDERLLTEEEAEIFRDEALFTLEHQYWAPNSPQWFNTGLYQTYGLQDSKDSIYHAEENGEAKKALNDYQYPQASACFILDVKDQLLGPGSISDHYVTETKLFKRGSGVGTNFSPIRAKDEKLSGGGTSSGLMSFLEGLDKNAGAIKSGGTTRRAAKMVILDVDHPEIEEFIDWKVREEEKAKALGREGYGMEIDGEAYSTVSGQNSNNSVRVTDKFMYEVEANGIWELKGRVDDSVNKKVNARELFAKMAEAAWKCGDPGIQFADEMNEWNTCKNSGKINATNPCSEFAFLDNTACNLASINIDKFVTKDGDDIIFDVESFEKVVRIAQLALEASIHWGGFPTEEIARNSRDFRPTGLGITNFGKVINDLGLKYSGRAAGTCASLICSYMTACSYAISGEMAERIGPFKKHEENDVEMDEVLSKHSTCTLWIDTYHNKDFEFMKAVTLAKWREVLRHKAFRNAQVTCIAPTGTISLAMDCETTGIEPYYSRETVKTLVDGSTIVTKNDNVLETAEEISPLDHVHMLAEITPFISGAISKTVNMPHDATVDDVRRVFEMAWLDGCKSVAIYRDGSKGTQVLNNKEDQQEENTAEKTKTELVRKKPSGIRKSKTHAAKIGDIELYITVGYYDNGDMAEVFISNDKEGTIVRGLLASLSKAISHQLQDGESPKEVSKMLRGQKYEPCGIVDRHPNIKFADSISDLVSKVIDLEIGDYTRIEVKPVYDISCDEVIFDTRMSDFDENGIPYWEKDEELESVAEYKERVYGEYCSNCGSDNLVRTGTCKVCLDCGTTTGCS